MTRPQASYLAVIGEREALAWVLRTNCMAFPGTKRPEIDSLSVGDELFLMTTRSCFHNPSSDSSRVIGTASVASPVRPLDDIVELAGRQFPRGCGINMQTLTPYRTGVELAPLVTELEAFAGATSTWGMRLRRSLVPLSSPDAALLSRKVRATARDSSEEVETYLARIKPVAVQVRRAH